MVCHAVSPCFVYDTIENDLMFSSKKIRIEERLKFKREEIVTSLIPIDDRLSLKNGDIFSKNILQFQFFPIWTTKLFTPNIFQGRGQREA